MAKMLLVVSVVGLLAGAARAEPAPEDEWAGHHGFTFELGYGVGLVHFSNHGNALPSSFDSSGNVAVRGGLGGWLDPQLALTFHFATIKYTGPADPGCFPPGDSACDRSHSYFGPAVQYWLNPVFWVGGGIGIAYWDHDQVGGGQSSLGFDLRTGFSPPMARHMLNISLELTTGSYNQDGSRGGTGIGAVMSAGFQLM
jgi:hypothetical protein